MKLSVGCMVLFASLVVSTNAGGIDILVDDKEAGVLPTHPDDNCGKKNIIETLECLGQRTLVTLLEYAGLKETLSGPGKIYDYIESNVAYKLAGESKTET